MKMIRNIVQINEDLCTGCGQCVLDCAEGAIQIIDGKAKVLSDHLCDGLGACIGGCPEGALVIVQRPAEAFDEEAVAAHVAAQGRCGEKVGGHGQSGHHHGHHHKEHHKEHHGSAEHECCGGQGHHGSDHECCGGQGHHKGHHGSDHECCGGQGHHKEHHGHEGHHGQRGLAPLAKGPLLKPFQQQGQGGQAQWPVKLRLITPTAAFLQQADIFLAADCAAALAFPSPKGKERDKVYMLACPKLEGAERITEHLAEIFAQAQPSTCTVAHVDIPCCRKLLEAVEAAKKLANADVAIHITGVTTQGDLQG